MARLDEEVVAWNPWWAEPGEIHADAHIQAFESAPVRWDPPLLNAVTVAPGDTHTLRGPRQVGKTTLVKRLLKDLIEAGERRVFYFSFDLHRTPEALYDAIKRAKGLHPDPEGPWYLFLDEVTSIPEWQRGVKAAWDQGLTRDDFLLLTGSSAHDLKSGAEQLPGRRGRGSDLLQLPMSFRDFCVQVEGMRLSGDAVGIDDLLEPEGRRLVREINLLMEPLNRAFRAYATVGGFPAAIRDYRTEPNRQAMPETIRMLWSAVAGDVARSGRDQTAAAKLLEGIGTALGNPLKWAGTARSMGMASHHTAREYTEFLSESFSLLTVFFWDLSGGALQPGKQRKVYYMDPLFGEVAPLLMPGARRPQTDGIIENVVAVGLFRSGAHALVQSGPVPGAIGYWRSSNGREIDFVVPSESRGRGGRLPVEVKGDAESRIAQARVAIEKAFGEGIVASRSIFDPTGDVPVLPVPVLLAALAEAPRRDAGIA